MLSKNTQRLRHADITPLHAHALGNLRFIRASIEAAGSLAIPGIAGHSMGAVGLAAALLAAMPDLRSYWLLIWLSAAVVALVVGSALLVHQARKAHALYRGPARKFVRCLFPGLFAGAALTAVLWRQGLAHLLPGVWLLLYGVALLAASTMTTTLVALMGALFMLIGLAAFGLPFVWQNALLGLSFGGLHVVFGVLIGRKSRDE